MLMCLWPTPGQEYYGVASDMSSEVALKIAAENQEAEEKRKEEAELQASLLQPIHVWIVGWVEPTLVLNVFIRIHRSTRECN